MGSKTFETMKSSKSRTLEPSPKGAKPDQRLKPRTQGIERRNIPTPPMRQTFFLDQPVRSMMQAMIFSNTAKTVESAAKERNTKKRLPQSLPKGMLLKIWGRVWKIKGGPALTFPSLKVKQAGKMIMPATRATPVSSTATLTASPRSERSLSI